MLFSKPFQSQANWKRFCVKSLLISGQSGCFLTARFSFEYHDLNKLEIWQNEWQMQFNPSKYNIICVSNKQRPPQRQNFFCGSKLEQVDSASYLGITVISKLKWSEHISSISSKASQSLGLIKRNLWNCPRKVRETAYTSIVRPKLEYASASWDPHYKKDISTLERVQRKAARFCLQNFSKTASVTDMLSDLKWDTLETRRKKKQIDFNVQTYS